MASLSNRKRGTVASNDCGKEKQSTPLEVVSSEKGTAGERLPRAAKRRKNTTDSTNQTTENTSLPQKISKEARVYEKGHVCPYLTPFSD